ncbi:hypothetical protein SCALM49S_07650 [Streptomyces californicus]
MEPWRPVTGAHRAALPDERREMAHVRSDWAIDRVRVQS